MDTVTLQGKAETITVNGIEYVPKSNLTTATDEKMRILIVDNRGLMFVGRCSLQDEDGWITIHSARCVIYWGTTQHIAELVKGPTSKTRLGAVASVRVNKNTIIAVYDCGGEWNDK